MIKKNNEDSISLIFGRGTISIGSGQFIKSGHGFVNFYQQEPKPIGGYEKNYKREVYPDEYPVNLIFENIESLDVVIERLQTTRKYMTGELNVLED